MFTAYYMGGTCEVKDSAVKKYYSIAGMMVAVDDGTGLQYLLTDHLGSTVAVTNQSGTLTSQQRYLPFGAARTIPNSPILGTDFTYTGQRKLDDGMGGIMDYKARFYSVGLMRFLQPDSVLPDLSNPQNFNRYTYTLNNPVLYKDPTGHCIDGVSTLVCIAVAGAIIGAAISYGAQVYDNYQNNDGDLGAALTTNIDGMSIVQSAVAGAVVAVGVAVAAPAVIALAGDALAGAGLMTGSTTLFSAGMSAYSLAGSTAAIVYGSGNLVSQFDRLKNPIGININNYAPGPDSGFSGIYDPEKDKILMRPSGDTLLTNGTKPSNIVERYGGHGLVNAEMEELYGTNTSQTVGFSVSYPSSGNLGIGWNSGVNSTNYGSRSVPAQFREGILRILSLYSISE